MPRRAGLKLEEYAWPDTLGTTVAADEFLANARAF
jgi:hypothetical protein